MNKFNNISNGNPFSNFNAVSINPVTNDFNTAFQINTSFIEKHDFRNKNNVLHNNMNENLLIEQIIEYIINIDSSDRSLTVYPSPFNFSVTFGGHGKITNYESIIKKTPQNIGAINESKFQQKTVQYNATPGPIIDRRFKNIKYIRLDYIILPISNIINSNIGSGSNNTEVLSTEESDKLSYKYKYLLLRVKEIKSDKILGTNRTLENDVFMLYPDKIMGNNHIMWLPTAGARTYKNSNLENITKLTFELLTPSGDILQIFNADNLEDEVVITTNTDDNIKDTLAVSMALIFGVIENELNTNTNF
jgi:hypothetical protein